MRGHLAGEHVGLQLLREHGAPHVLAPPLPLRRSLPFGNRRELAPGEIAHLPFLTLGKLVEAHDAAERVALVCLLFDDLSRRDPLDPIDGRGGAALVFIRGPLAS